MSTSSAEDAFSALTRDWYDEVRAAEPNALLPSTVDDLALAALFIAVGWGQSFSGDARRQIEKNRSVIGARGDRAWLDRISWDLCLASMEPRPAESTPVGVLMELLEHHNSSIRVWAIELGWVVRPWLDVEEALPILLKNFADSLFGVSRAAGLAAALASDADDFWRRAEAYQPPPNFEDQYRDRLDILRKDGIMARQAVLLNREVRCRKAIEAAAFGGEVGPDHKARLEDQDGELSEDRIRRIAYDYLREADDGAPGVIRKIVRGDQLTGRKPMVYMGPDWDKQWVVYFGRDYPSGSFVIGPSTIMAIDRETGEVTYYGSANDEG